MTITTDATASTTVALTHEQLKTPKGNLKARKALDDGKRVTITVTGPEAFAVGSAIARNGGPGVSTVTGVEVALAAVVIAGVVAALGLGVVAVVCLYGMHLGYTVRARHEVRSQGTVFDDRLVFILVPPAGTDR